MSNNRHGSAQRAARPVSQDQFPPPNPWPTVNIITPDCTRRPMELQLIRFGQALMQLRYAYIEMLHHFNQLKSCPVDIHPGHARTASDQSQGSNQNPANICSTTVSNEMQEPETTQIMSSTESEDTLYSDDDTVYAKKESHEPSTNNVPSGMLKTFDQMMDELPQRRKRPYTKLKQSEVNKMRKMGACYDCRANKRKCNPDHPRDERHTSPRRRSMKSKAPARLSSRLEAQSSSTRTRQPCPRSTPEIPALFSGVQIRRPSLPDLGLSDPDVPRFSAYRRAHGVPKKLSIDHQRLHGVSTESSSSLHQSIGHRPAFGNPTFGGPSNQSQDISVGENPDTVLSRYDGMAWPGQYPPCAKDNNASLLPSYPHDMIDSFVHPTQNGLASSRRGDPGMHAQNSRNVYSWMHLDDPFQPRMVLSCHGDSLSHANVPGTLHIHSEIQDQGVVSPITQVFNGAPQGSPHPLQARPDIPESGVSRTTSCLVPSPRCTPDQRNPSLLPIKEVPNHQSPSVPFSGNPSSSRLFPTHSRVSTPDIPDLDWGAIL